MTRTGNAPPPRRRLGEWVRYQRHVRFMTQDDLAEHMAPHYRWVHSTVAKIEAGTRHLRADEYLDLVELFDASPLPTPPDLAPTP